MEPGGRRRLSTWWHHCCSTKKKSRSRSRSEKTEIRIVDMVRKGCSKAGSEERWRDCMVEVAQPNLDRYKMRSEGAEQQWRDLYSRVESIGGPENYPLGWSILGDLACNSITINHVYNFKLRTCLVNLKIRNKIILRRVNEELLIDLKLGQPRLVLVGYICGLVCLPTKIWPRWPDL